MNLETLPVASVINRLESLAPNAADEVTRLIYEKHPELDQRFGDKGKATCREDLLHHIDYLVSALYAADSAPFREYVLWLSGVLESRGVPSAHLKESLLLLQEHFARLLTPDELPVVSAPLLEGVKTLDGSAQTGKRFNRLLPQPMPESRDYLKALLAGERPAAQEVILNMMRRDISLADVAVSVIQPAMYEVGYLWACNRITVAQEHMATAITQNTMARAFAEARFSEPLGRKALFACVPGNNHSLGLRIVSDAFEVDGWTVQYLGADVPVSDLVVQISHWRPELVGISLSLPGHIKIAKAFVEQLRAEFGTCCPAILVGGLATNQADNLWKAVDADLWAANAKEAVKEVK